MNKPTIQVDQDPVITPTRDGGFALVYTVGQLPLGAEVWADHLTNALTSERDDLNQAWVREFSVSEPHDGVIEIVLSAERALNIEDAIWIDRAVDRALTIATEKAAKGEAHARQITEELVRRRSS
ncbi:hypothetical protein [Tsukamurella sp. USMM236]|uniref:hypothetical protein n=1 Tax=Tsukamurella sp. USMM236 TaxID=3081301 RepID=UPI00301697E6